jgi:hypothetical protein
LPFGIGEDAALHSEPGEALGHLALEVALELRPALRILALGRDGDATREVGVEAASVKVLQRGPDCGLSGHGDRIVRGKAGRVSCHPQSLLVR